MRQRWYQLLVLVLLASVLVAPLVLAGNGKISGVVKGADGTPAVGANVVLEGTTLGASADVNGRYFILNIPPGTYRVRASAVGFTPKVVTDVRVGSDQIITVDFSLQSEAVGLAEVVVQAERPPVDKSQTSARTRLSGDDFTTLPANNVNDLIATSASTYKGFVRGGRIFETKTLIDGIDVTDQYNQYVADAVYVSTAYGTYNGIMHQNEMQSSSLVGLSMSSVEEANVLTGGVGSDYSSASAGIISYNLREGRGKWTGRVEGRTSQTGGLTYLGPDAYNDYAAYNNLRNTLAASTVQANRDKAARFTYYPGKYTESVPTYNIDVSAGGSIGENLGLYLTGAFLNSYGRLPNEHTMKVNGSLKANYNFTPEMKLNATFLMEDRGKLFGWKNRTYAEDFRYYLEGVPTWNGANLVGSLKWTHVLSPGTYYEVQASILNDNTMRGFAGTPNANGSVTLDDSKDFITFADTAIVYMIEARGNSGNTEMNKFFSPAPRNETASENTVALTPAGATNLKIARPGIYFEDFTNQVMTFKGDITSQLDEHHQLRGGLQFRMHDLDMIRRAGYIGGVFSTYKNFAEEIWNVKPKEYSAYVQDKMEYAGLIINLGLRLDGLDLSAGDYANYYAPFKDQTDASGGPVRVPVRGDNAKIKWFLAPRVGVSHPISDNAAMYFSFSRAQQSQPFSRLFTNYQDFGNPSLPSLVRTDQDPIRSTSYDLGIQWSFLEGYGLDINAYYKDIQSYGANGFTVTPNAPWRLYNISTEFGYADSRGIELTLNKQVAPVASWLSIGGKLTYAYSYIKQSVGAGGNQSGFSTAAGDSLKYSGNLPWDDMAYWNTIERNVVGGNSTITGGYDRPQRITYNLVMRFPWEITLSSVGTFQSGFFFPLTLGDPRARELGQSPWSKKVDFRLEKAFTFSGIGRVAVYVDLINAFSWTNIVAYNSSNVGQIAWERTGDPTGGPTINRPIGISAAGNDASLVYDVPREVYFGIVFNF
jgi:hypothetical protein